ncbi:MAG: DUF4230 domain-containing protein [Ruminococcaceae bacterium]|nr:DUF4230 domain-containing protein [Oscillospiraceae bacterium]
MKEIRKPLTVIISSILVIGLTFVGGYFAGINQLPDAEIVDNTSNSDNLKLPGEQEKRVITIEEINSELVKISELSTYASEYEVTKSADYTRYFLDDIPVPGTTNNTTLKCKGIVKVGYDLSEINPVVDNDSCKIYIALPEIAVNDNYIIWETVECIEDNNILNPIDFSQYKQLVTEMEALGLKDAEDNGIYKNGEKYVQELITNFLRCFDGYEVIFI